MKNRIFFYPGFERYILFTSEVLSHMYSYAQNLASKAEAGGEIYSPMLDTHGLTVTGVEGPNPEDSRGRYHFNPDVRKTTFNRLFNFENGLHVIGLWHTHPEAKPHPSEQDFKTGQHYLKAFNGDRCCYFMVILGNSGNPLNMTVWSISGGNNFKWVELKEA